MTSLTPSQNCFDLAKKFEGLRLAAYQDNGGVWTIAYGHTHNVGQHDTCTLDQANQFLADDMASAAYWVNELVLAPLNQNQFDALCDFVFNLGPDALRTSHLLLFTNQSQWDEAAGEFGKWIHAGGIVLPGLVARRAAEKALFTQGV